MKYCKSNLFSIFLIIVAVIIVVSIGGSIFRALKQSSVYEGFSSASTPNWVIAGSTNDGSTPTTGYSMDGVNWTITPLSISNTRSLSCVACNSDASLWLAGCNNGFLTSTDGINWTQNNNSNLYDGVASIFWSKEKSMWVNVGTTSQPNGWSLASIEYSTNGTSWTQCANNFGAGGNSNFSGVTYNNSINGGTWVAVGRQFINNSYGPIVVYSTDGINWGQSSSAQTNFPGGSLQSVISMGSNGFTAVGVMNPPVLTSVDGNTWIGGWENNSVMSNPFSLVYANNRLSLIHI